jgi:DNA recombination protein RmuC
MQVLLVCLLVVAAFAALFSFLAWRRAAAPSASAELEARHAQLRAELERIERSVREEVQRSERALRDEQRGGRVESNAVLAGFDTRLGQFTERTDTGLGALRQNLGDDARRGREEAAAGLQRLAESLHARLEKLNETTERRLGEVRQSLDLRLKDIQQDNAAKLEQMRQTVDEKLQTTLETRLGESFRLVSERLEQVHRGLGEMQSLATGVGDLKRVLGNVKTRGVWGEVQLAGILEQMLTPDQYEANVAVVPGSSERVEFAIRLPGAGDRPDVPVRLPIDAKFPREDYERLLDAQERADADGAAIAGLALERRIREEAKAICQKYVSPPHTTDFAILFLPTEGLYAEVLRRPGLVDVLQREQRIVLAGPTTLSAILNSLRMGFRTLAIEQRSSEVWQVLGAVKTEFGKFAGVLEKTRKKLSEATSVIDQADVRTRAIERKLRGVEAATDDDSRKLLGGLLEIGQGDPDAAQERDLD